MICELQLGQLVCSKAGRDRNGYYLVTGTEGDCFIYLVDGSRRLVEKPKRKNIRHVQTTNKIAHEIAVKLAAGMRISNGDIRQAISYLTKAEKEEGISEVGK
jgi:large subunit ribosomal protein L14e